MYSQPTRVIGILAGGRGSLTGLLRRPARHLGRRPATEPLVVVRSMQNRFDFSCPGLSSA